MERMSGSRAKKARQAISHRFTLPGEPGEKLRPVFDSFLAGLRLPPGVAGSDAALAAGLEGDQVLIVPAFFDLLVHLKRVGRSFSLVFRTFGEDLPKVVKELNAFCEGRHPLYPGVCMDGSDGGPDYRVSWDDPTSFGCFFRGTETGSDALILGTLEQPKLGEGLEFYQDTTRFPRIQITSGGILPVHRALRSATMRPRALAIKDYWDVWRHTGEGQDPGRHNFGKLLTVDNNDKVQGMFFDDNILYHCPKIVDVRHIGLPDKVFSAMYSLMVHLVRADMFDAVLNRRYFIEHVDVRSRHFARRMAMQKQFFKVLRRAIIFKMPKRDDAESESSGEEFQLGRQGSIVPAMPIHHRHHRDAWTKHKQSIKAMSSVVTFREREDLLLEGSLKD